MPFFGRDRYVSGYYGLLPQLTGELVSCQMGGLLWQHL